VAQKMVVEVLDDIDGSPADRTVTFGFDGRDYEIDLSSKHADQLAKALEPFVAGARKVSSSRRRTSSASAPKSKSKSKQDLADVRAWAKTQPDLKVSDRGRIPQAVFQAYEQAH
jgi:Lsr2